MDFTKFFFKSIDRKLDLILSHLESIMTKQTEIVEQLDAMTAQVGKIRSEVQALLDIIANLDDASPDLVAAAGRTQAALQGLDDMNADTPPPAP